MKNKSKILIGALTATILLSFASFVFAQSTDPNNPVGPVAPAENSGLSLTSWNAAQASQAACLDFKNKVSNFTSGDYKAVWFPAQTVNTDRTSITTKSSCHVTEANFSDTNGNPSYVSLGANYLEAQILNSKDGINATAYQAAKAKESIEQQNASGIQSAIASILAYIIGALTWFVLYIASWAGYVLSWAIDKSAFSTLPPVVSTGWTVVRDVFNVFFVLALIVMSLATILRRPENYQARNLILRLILMALLINFSLSIGLALIHAADTVTAIFAKGADLKGFFELTKGIIKPEQATIFSTGGIFTQVTQALSAFVLALMMMSAFLAIAGLLIVRYVGLIVLLVFSPAAFALNIIPYTQRFWKQWWENFIKYLIWAPVAVFFLRLGSLFFQKGVTNTLYSDTDSAFTLVIIGMFYWAAFFVTKNSGVYGAQAITGYAQSAANMTGKYFARGSFITGAGKGLEKITGGRVPQLKKAGEFVERQTARVEALPKTISQPLARSEGARQREVAKQSRLDQIKLGLLPIDKDSAGSLSFEELKLINSKGKLNDRTIGTLYEHGGGGQRASLLAMLNSGQITDEKSIKAIREGEWNKIGGRGTPTPDKFLVDRDENNQLVDVYISNPTAEPKDQKIRSVNTRFREKRGQRASQESQPSQPNERNTGRGSGNYQNPPGFGSPINASIGSDKSDNNPKGPTAMASPVIPPSPKSAPGGGVSPIVAATSQTSSTASAPKAGKIEISNIQVPPAPKPVRPVGFNPIPPQNVNQPTPASSAAPDFKAVNLPTKEIQTEKTTETIVNSTTQPNSEAAPQNEEVSHTLVEVEAGGEKQNVQIDASHIDKAAKNLENSAQNINKAAQNLNRSIGQSDEAAKSNLKNQMAASKESARKLDQGNAGNIQKLGEVLKNAAGTVKEKFDDHRSATSGQVKKIDQKIDTIKSDVKDLKKETIIRDENHNIIPPTPSDSTDSSTQSPLNPQPPINDLPK